MAQEFQLHDWWVPWVAEVGGPPAPIVGKWIPGVVEKRMGDRCYTGNWVPYFQNQEAKLGHTGQYLTLRIGGWKAAKDNWRNYHQQLKQDERGQRVDGEKWHVHHLKGKLDNALEHLKIKWGKLHLAEHGAEGGRPRGQKRKW